MPHAKGIPHPATLRNNPKGQISRPLTKHSFSDLPPSDFMILLLRTPATICSIPSPVSIAAAIICVQTPSCIYNAQLPPCFSYDRLNKFLPGGPLSRAAVSFELENELRTIGWRYSNRMNTQSIKRIIAKDVWSNSLFQFREGCLRI